MTLAEGPGRALGGLVVRAGGHRRRASTAACTSRSRRRACTRFCTPGDIPLLPRVLDAADRYAGLDEAQRRAAVEAMATEDVIFPMAG